MLSRGDSGELTPWGETEPWMSQQGVRSTASGKGGTTSGPRGGRRPSQSRPGALRDRLRLWMLTLVPPRLHQALGLPRKTASHRRKTDPVNRHPISLLRNVPAPVRRLSPATSISIRDTTASEEILADEIIAFGEMGRISK